MIALLAASRVLPSQDALVRFRVAPTLKLGGTHRVEWMVSENGVEHLEGRVPGATGGLILFGLDEKLVEID
jgi:hypothetical protein